MRFFFILLFSCCLYNLKSQDTSLTRILDLDSDTEQVNQLYARCNALRHSDLEKAWYYAQLCEERAQIAESPKHLAKSYNMLGVLYYKKGDLKTAQAYHQRALDIRMACGDEHGAAMSRVNLANIYTDVQLFDKAEENYLAAHSIYQRRGDKRRAGDCLMNLGVLKQNLHQTNSARENYSQALKIAEDLNDYDMRSRCLNNLAQIFYEQGDYERSIAFNQDALKLRSMMDNSLEVADSYLNLAANSIKLADFKAARYYLDTAVVVSQRYKYHEALLLSTKIRADYFAGLKDFEQAYHWLTIYHARKDSLIAAQMVQEPFDFGMPEVLGSDTLQERPVQNRWLLITSLIFTIFVPYLLFRLKR